MRKLVPGFVRGASYPLRLRLWATRTKRHWERLPLTYDLNGLHIRLSSRSDWMIYNEIFVGGVYDAPIREALARAPADRPFRVLDLGANTGFFAMKVAHEVFQHAPDRPFHVHCIEGSPLVHAELAARIADQPRLAGHVTVTHGLVGRRDGNARIFESSFGAGSSLVPGPIPQGVEVDFVDVEQVVGPNTPIDLIKCDIEGSELAFVQTYPALLSRAAISVFELHPPLCDTEQCERMIRQAGAAQREVLRPGEKTLVVQYGR